MYTAAEDIETGTIKPKLQTEPTLPIYLKVNKLFNLRDESEPSSFTFLIISVHAWVHDVLPVLKLKP